MTASNKTKVVYILGEGRSGSTLLDRLLGQVDGFFSTGELKLIWEWAFGENMLCGCGQPFKSCPFWTNVLREAFGGVENVDARRMRDLSEALFRFRRLPQLLGLAPGRKYRASMKEFGAVVRTLYQATQRVAGCRVLIDSSKNNRYALALGRLPDIDLHIVHIVRDSRAVAYSWLRKKRRPEVYWTTAFMYQYGCGYTAVNYLCNDALTQGMRPLFKQYTRVRYEDLVADPRATLTRICRAVGEPAPALDFLAGSTAFLGTGHTVAGNPMRFQEGPVEIKQDDEWVAKLGRRQKLVVAAITWPLLLQYGYFGRAHRCGEPESVAPVK